MSKLTLPERASLEYLKKLAKDRLRELRAAHPEARLAAAQLGVARDHGFASWRALKAHVERIDGERIEGERGRVPAQEAFFAACRWGDTAVLSALLEVDAALVHARDAEGSPGLHLAVAHPDCVRLLLAHGSDPDERDRGDLATALHFAAAGGHLESVRALLDAGADPEGRGDLHEAEVIGWAVGDGAAVPREVVALLLARGARHHIFSALGCDDTEVVRALVEADPEALHRRRSRFDGGQTPLHYALAAPDGRQAKAPQHAMLRLLIELGADLEARDDRDRTPLALAMLRGDLASMRILKTAGAKEPERAAPADGTGEPPLGDAMHRPVTPMLCVEDVEATVGWYTALGFTLEARYPETGAMSWAALAFGRRVELMVQQRGGRAHAGVALWFHHGRLEELYQRLKDVQLRAAQAALAGEPDGLPEVHFLEDLYQPFHGGRQFSVRDPDGIELVFQSE